MKPEEKARELIDQKLIAAGWVIQHYKKIDLSAGFGIAVCEYRTDSGPADYVLFVNGQPCGVIEAKKDQAGATLNAAEAQTQRYVNSGLKWHKDKAPLRFIFEATGQIIYFTDSADPAPRAREVFHFFQPQQLHEWLQHPSTLRCRLVNNMPALPAKNLRACQANAVTGLETSLAQNRPRALIHMATGAGKTFTAITSIYRLLKFGGAKRILFLVDTRNLGKQAHQEFMAYTPPDDSRKFTELYTVQRLSSGNINPHAPVCISTIQRMYSILSGEPLDESAEDDSPNEAAASAPDDKAKDKEKFVQYNPAVPIETFDFIVIDECHRSIYNRWKQVLDYFDAYLIGLTATPDKRTFGFFNQNIVAEYSYEDSVTDGVNVGYDVYTIETAITQQGAQIAAQQWVDHRDRATRKKRWAETEDDITYSGKELDRSVVNPSQIRTVIKSMKQAVEQSIFDKRKETPKTLIFAKTDSHADDIIRIVREEYGQGNEFCKKVTYRAGKEIDPATGKVTPGDDAESVLASFRNDYNPRIAVTVDMIATGTDVKALEVLLFMRDVRSKGYYEQMKGRGVRSLDAEGLQRVTQSATGAKERFILIDAVGVEKSLKTESRPLEKKPSATLKDLLQAIACGQRDDDTVLSLGNRLLRLDKQLDDKAQTHIHHLSGGASAGALGKALVKALDIDAIVQTALEMAQAQGKTATEDTLTEADLAAARHARVQEACHPLNNPALREALDSARSAAAEQVIDTINLDEVTYAGFSAQAQAKAQADVQRFADYLNAHKDEIEALSFFYQQPYQRRTLTLDMLEALHDHLSAPPLMLTTDRLWNAYARIHTTQVQGGDKKRQLTDLISLMRFALALEASSTAPAAQLQLELRPFSEEVDKRFQAWIFRHNAQRATAFTPEQTAWLRMMKDHIASSCCIERDDFDYAEFAHQGGLQKAWGLFGPELDTLMNEMNWELVA